MPASAKEFLDTLCESYGLVWYFDGAVLHVNAKAELKTELISIGRLPPSEVTVKLGGAGKSPDREMRNRFEATICDRRRGADLDVTRA